MRLARRLVSAVCLAVVAPSAAYADKKDRAQEAIAAAEAKLHTAEGIGAGVETPTVTANARAALLTAKENLAAGHKSLAIERRSAPRPWPTPPWAQRLIRRMGKTPAAGISFTSRRSRSPSAARSRLPCRSLTR